MEATAGHAVFRNERGEPYVQLFWQISPGTLHYKKDSLGRLTARIRTQIRIAGDTGIVYQDVFFLQTKPFSPEREEAPRILEQERIPVGPGNFTIELFLAEDGRSDSRYYYRDTFTVNSANPQYSTIQLLDTFFASSVPSAFLKDGFQQLPRPLNFYDEGQQTVHAYTELNGTTSLPQDAFPLKQVFYFSKRQGEHNAGSDAVDTITGPKPIWKFRHSLSSASLPSGNYWLNVSLRAASGIELASSATFFQTVNKSPSSVRNMDMLDSAEAKRAIDASILDLGKTFVARFTMPQLRAVLKMMRPGADAAEESAIHGFLQRPDDLYMRYFIYNHFAAINKDDPGKAWKDFSDVVRDINRRFGSSSAAGYETDRGIVYLRYGKPDEEVRVPNEAGALPYEIWRYNPNQKMHGPGVFLFYSPGAMSSDFRLLHSTVLGETQNPAWRDMLYSTGRSSGNLNARAEEYLGK
jgi:GWxTD domain-containing protein